MIRLLHTADLHLGVDAYGRLDPATSFSTRVADCLASLDLAVAAAIVYFGVRLRRGEPIEVSFRLLLTAYFYLLTIAGFIVLLLGLSGLLNAGLGVVLGGISATLGLP